ncbi:hypothetical protein FNH05_03420, partial [Amycolatopsis rhizosphaerae]
MSEPLRVALADQLILSRAQDAARDGDLAEAARLLDELEPAVPVLDLRARVHAQAGELVKADACWARVQLLEPGHEGAEAGRAAVARIRSGGRARPLVTPGRTATAAALIAVAAVTGGILWASAAGGGPAGASSGASNGAAGEASGGGDAALAAAVQRADTLQQRLAALDAGQRAAADERSRRLDRIAAQVALPGVRVERRADEVRVVFDEGLFSSGTEPARQAPGLLAELGRRLTGLPVSVTVVGHAVAVPGGPSSGGSPVALARAEVAAEHLARGSGLPLTAFRLATADQSDAPHPD